MREISLSQVKPGDKGKISRIGGNRTELSCVALPACNSLRPRIALVRDCNRGLSHFRDSVKTGSDYFDSDRNQFFHCQY